MRRARREDNHENYGEESSSIRRGPSGTIVVTHVNSIRSDVSGNDWWDIVEAGRSNGKNPTEHYALSSARHDQEIEASASRMPELRSACNNTRLLGLKLSKVGYSSRFSQSLPLPRVEATTATQSLTYPCYRLVTISPNRKVPG
jgi:hypothetical protein